MIKRLGTLLMVVSHFSMASLVSADNAPGYPSREADLDALPGFQTPPPGYGEVPFWWWSGEDLDVDRLLNQVHALHEKGISGVQGMASQRWRRIWGWGKGVRLFLI